MCPYDAVLNVATDLDAAFTDLRERDVVSEQDVGPAHPAVPRHRVAWEGRADTRPRYSGPRYSAPTA